MIKNSKIIFSTICLIVPFSSFGATELKRDSLMEKSKPLNLQITGLTLPPIPLTITEVIPPPVPCVAITPPSPSIPIPNIIPPSRVVPIVPKQCRFGPLGTVSEQIHEHS